MQSEKPMALVSRGGIVSDHAIILVLGRLLKLLLYCFRGTVFFGREDILAISR